MKDKLSKNLIELHGRIASACDLYDRDVDDITIIAITKTHPAAVIKMAIAAGLHSIGESRVQEAEQKFEELGHIGRFHLVGHLQSNKAKKAVQLFDVIQSVDSLSLAREISKQVSQIDRTIECYLQVNSSGEKQKYGVTPQETLDLVGQINELPNIELTGLMTVGPHTDDETKIRSAYATCRELFKKAHIIIGPKFDTLSMGMSGDFELAIAEGATMIRVGSSLFGDRPPLT